MKQLKHYVEQWKGRLRAKLEGLSPKTRLRLVVMTFMVLALGCLFQIGMALYRFGNGNGRTDFGRIESVSLSSGREFTKPYHNFEHGTEKRKDGQDAVREE